MKTVNLHEAKTTLSQRGNSRGRRASANCRSCRRFRFQDLSWEDAERANQLPAHHKDPMDRMLIATALGNDMMVITDDNWFAAYGVKTVW
jgi:PIN domain nuclease of toxin-antitoxin system